MIRDGRFWMGVGVGVLGVYVYKRVRPAVVAKG